MLTRGLGIFEGGSEPRVDKGVPGRGLEMP